MVDREKPKNRGKNKEKISETTNNCFTEDKVYTQYYPKAIIEFSNASQKDKLHPTQKPLDLITKLILQSSNEGDLVLDPFMGSGTTAIACMNTNRKYIGFELDKHYCEIANERIQKALAKKEVGDESRHLQHRQEVQHHLC